MADTSQRFGANPKLLRDRLSSWDSKVNPKAPLTDKQKDALITLTNLTATRPISKELPVEDAPFSPTRVLAGPVFKAAAAAVSPDGSGHFTFTETEKIENAQQFFSWFAELEDQIEKEEEAPARSYMGELCGYQGQCSGILQEVDIAMEQLYQLNRHYIHVSTKTNSLHEACEHLLAEQTQLVNTAESISNKLSYFNELERISSKLGSPTLTVTCESFVPMLSRLDECILYLQNNSRYKESDVYLARFRQSLSRALNCIKSHVVNILQNTTHQVQPKRESGDVTDNAFTLFYGKFRANAPRVKSLMEQIEQRIDKSPEYQQLLGDCHQCYFSQREQLLGPSVASAITELASRHTTDHCALMRSGCAFMVHVCEDEYQLYFNFFSKPTPVLDEMLEKLCYHLYDTFRPLIIHINHLETLAELCSILKVEMMEEHVQNNPQELCAFAGMCKQMLMDVQERLVYRTYIYIRSDILNFVPAMGDLAYPEKLEMMESIAEGLKKNLVQGQHSRTPSNASAASQEVAQINSGTSEEEVIRPDSKQNGVTNHVIPEAQPVTTTMPMSPADLHGMWYPTVRRTLVCLSKLYRCIDRSTFQGLSQEALYMCIESLKFAKDGITKRKALLDGQLFLVKHLLILREQIAPFQADFSIRETTLDFSTLKDAAYHLFQHKSHLFALNSNNALLQFFLEGTPHVTESFVDSKKEVDNNLKRTCEAFIHHVTSAALGPVTDFLSRADTVMVMQNEGIGTKISLKTQPFATPEKLHDVIAETYKNIKTKVPGMKRSMSLYLANRDTEFILFKPIKGNIVQAFQQLDNLLLQQYTEEDQQIVACPSQEQINLLLSTPARQPRGSTSSDT